jgi:phage shock protein PspC (stress-responsive transcriptional regulator)
VHTLIRVLFWLTQINLGAALGIFAYLVYSNMNPIALAPNYPLSRSSPTVESVGEVGK